MTPADPLAVAVALLLGALAWWRTTRAAGRATVAVRNAQTAHDARRKVEPPTDAVAFHLADALDKHLDAAEAALNEALDLAGADTPGERPR